MRVPRTVFLAGVVAALAACAPATRPAAAPPPPNTSTAPPTTTTTTTTTVSPATRPAAAPPPNTSTAPPTTTTTTTTVSPAPAPPPPPCAPTVRACVSLSTRQAWLMSAGIVDYGPVPIAHGGPNHRTPAGTFPVSWKDADNTSSIYGTPMPYSVFFAPGGIAFHEGSVTEDSHGCVRLTAEAARTFFDNLTAGQLVQVVA